MYTEDEVNDWLAPNYEATPENIYPPKPTGVPEAMAISLSAIEPEPPQYLYGYSREIPNSSCLMDVVL